jgi:hypothetical protein
MKTRRFSYFFAMLAIVLAGCSDIDNVLNPQTDGGETLPFSTVIPAGSAAPTRGLEISTDGKSIKAKWVKGEKIALVHGETIDEMTVSAVDTDGNATITGEVTSYVDGQTAYLVYAGTRRADPTDDAILTDYIDILGNAYTAAKAADASLKAITKEIILKTFDISEQSGTINDINETSDYRLGDSKLTKKGACATLTTSPVLQSQFAVWKLSLRDATSALSAQKLDIYDADGKPFITGVVSSTSVSDFYYLLPAASNATYTFVAAAADGNIYSCTTKNITLEAGKYYRSTLTLKQDMRATPLTFEANAANAAVTFNVDTDVATNPVSYRQYDSSAKAWTDWTAYTDNTPVELTNSGDKVQFKAENATYATGSSYSNIQCSGDCYAYGNIMSLTDGDSFSTADELTGTYTFKELFSHNSYLQIDASRPLLLPAETLKEGCYNAMFLACTKLTVAPVLPAKTLVNNCYCEMFEGCAKLGSVTCLATNIDAANCLYQWLKGAGTDSSCERKVYVDPSMMTKEYGDRQGEWYFESSGDGSTNTWSLAVAPHALADVTSADLGKVISADGMIYTNKADATAAGTTAVAIIAYVGSAGSVDESSSTYKGLAIALNDVSGQKQWYTEQGGTCVSQTSDVATAVSYKNGIASTNTLTTNSSGTCNGHTHEAAAVCRSYTPAAPTTYTSDWFLPSIGQWQLIVQGLASKKAGTPVTTALTMIVNDSYKSSNLNSVITDAGGTGFQDDSYWSSTENDTRNAWSIYFRNGVALGSSKFFSIIYYDCYVRPVLAF